MSMCSREYAAGRPSTVPTGQTVLQTVRPERYATMQAAIISPKVSNRALTDEIVSTNVLPSFAEVILLTKSLMYSVAWPYIVTGSRTVRPSGRLRQARKITATSIETRSVGSPAVWWYALRLSRQNFGRRAQMSMSVPMGHIVEQ